MHSLLRSRQHCLRPLREVEYVNGRVRDSLVGTCKPHSDNPFLRWDEKAGLRRDAVRSQRLTRLRRNGKETGL